ncbi:hypothetical protein KSC_067330 [Ktedonobacter sp. SOSP1-52]|uniref:hypothetical protein n=1 Tax=Ktedonobacter sp. SOSP1-52 TaxID=2778366 RepID=UPI001916AF97|nr:hypothetical protein [Ktedonobacter sp. SOSP1-52]GHO67841.1 hypothetical protein KSC_067330 [Ktedonobacter sp. SOSP1-52]
MHHLGLSQMISGNEPIVAFTLIRYQEPSLRTLVYLGLDRWTMARTPGLHFWRLLGVGQGKAFDSHADLRRSAIFSVWHSYAALHQFEVQSALMKRVQSQAEEVWTVYMQPVRWHGVWGGQDPFREMMPVSPPQPGPWVILTRATIRPNRVRAFLGAVPAVAEQLLEQPALLNSVGIGEAPLFYQATLSLWQSLPDVTAFAYGQQAHREVIWRTRQEGWYSEELFARFRPLAASGTWDGTNPLSQLMAPAS